jgi:hypothetical protein
MITNNKIQIQVGSVSRFKLAVVSHHHHHHQPNVPTAGAAFLMDYTQGECYINAKFSFLGLHNISLNKARLTLMSNTCFVWTLG